MNAQADLLTALAEAVKRARTDRLAAPDDVAVECVDCDIPLDEDNTAVACDDHPICMRCEDPHVACRGCREARNQITTDLYEDHLCGLAEDMEH